MLSLKSKMQCRDRSDLCSGEVINPSLVHEMSRCMNNAEKNYILFPLPPVCFFLKCECKAVSVSEVAVSSHPVLSVDACARFFHPLWRAMGFCIAAALCSLENRLR